MTSPTPHRFKQPGWELGDLIGWVLDRDSAKFGRTFTSEDCSSTLWIAKFYERQSVADPNADTTILHALQAGELNARDRDGQPVRRDVWMARNEIDLRRACREYLFYSEDCLRLWPERPIEQCNDGLPVHIVRGLRGCDMIDENDPLAGRHRREKWRREWINKFRERQHIARRWIEFVEISKWCARSTTGTSAEDEQRALELGYQRLADSVLRGEFEAAGRSEILYLEPTVMGDGMTPRCRLTREQFEIAFDVAAMPPAPSLPLTVLNCCWLPSEMARRWLESHGYRWAPHFESAYKRRPAQAIPDFDLRLGWIPLANALEVIGTDAWEAVKKVIRREALRARCRADGITRDLKPHWLDFLAFDYPDEDVLWFDQEKVWRARTRDASLEGVPDRASEIVLLLAQCRELWPEVAWPEAGHPTDEFAGGTDPLGHRVHPFIIGVTHTIFEWCMIYTDRRPAVLNPNYDGATLRDKEFRLTLLGATGGGLRDAHGQPMGPPNDPEEQIRNEIYRELVRDIGRDRIIPVKTAYCSDAPDVFDPTRCLLDIEPIIAVARRRGDFGPTLADLLAQHGNKSRDEKSRSVPPSREKAFWAAARVAACEWLTENGCPAPGDGNQAELERWLTKWLEDRGHEASESAVRRHVARCIKERRAELSA